VATTLWFTTFQMRHTSYLPNVMIEIVQLWDGVRHTEPNIAFLNLKNTIEQSHKLTEYL
jgi:hypothetical protein